MQVWMGFVWSDKAVVSAAVADDGGGGGGGILRRFPIRE